MANKTLNYELVKSLSNENYDVSVQNGNMEIIDAALAPTADSTQIPAGNGPGKLSQWVNWLTNCIKAITGKANWWDAPSKTLEDINTHLADYVRQPAFGPTTGEANTYLFTTDPAPAAYVDGMSAYLDINVANTGASTLNWNGLGAKPIVTGKGAALTAGKLPANSIVGVRYNASVGNFQLLGEGGEYGNVTPNDVVVGKIFGTDEGLKEGTYNKTFGSGDKIYPSQTEQKEKLLHRITGKIPQVTGVVGKGLAYKNDKIVIAGYSTSLGAYGWTKLNALTGAQIGTYGEGYINSTTGSTPVCGTPDDKIYAVANMYLNKWKYVTIFNAAFAVTGVLYDCNAISGAGIVELLATNDNKKYVVVEGIASTISRVHKFGATDVAEGSLDIVVPSGIHLQAAVITPDQQYMYAFSSYGIYKIKLSDMSLVFSKSYSPRLISAGRGYIGVDSDGNVYAFGQKETSGQAIIKFSGVDGSVIWEYAEANVFGICVTSEGNILYLKQTTNAQSRYDFSIHMLTKDGSYKGKYDTRGDYVSNSATWIMMSEEGNVLLESITNQHGFYRPFLTLT